MDHLPDPFAHVPRARGQEIGNVLGTADLSAFVQAVPQSGSVVNNYPLLWVGPGWKVDRLPLAALIPAGTNGWVLATLAGVPTWTDDLVVNGSGLVVVKVSLRIASSPQQTGAGVSSRQEGTTHGNDYEFGHSNTAGFGSVLGHEVNSGQPNLVFAGENGTTNNTYRTRGNYATILKCDLLGSLFVGYTSANNADNQAFTLGFKYVSSTGTLLIADNTAINSPESASPRLYARGSGTNIEWGHQNHSGYASSLGGNVSSGNPFIGLSALAGTTSGTWKTTGLKGVVLTTDGSGGFSINSVPNASADNQSTTVMIAMNSNGVTQFGTVGGSSGALVQARSGAAGAATLGNAVEFGHPTLGFHAVLGYETGSGAPNLIFDGENGSTGNTYRTRANKATILKSDNAGALLIGTVASANADNQAFVQTASISATGKITSLARAGTNRTDSAAFTVPTGGVDTTITTWATSVFDNGGTSFNTGVWTVTEAGIYIVTTSVTWSGAVTSSKCRIYQNSSAVASAEPGVTTTAASSQTASAIIKIAVNDTVSIRMAQNSAAGVNVTNRFFGLTKVSD